MLRINSVFYFNNIFWIKEFGLYSIFWIKEFGLYGIFWIKEFGSQKGFEPHKRE
jgi:hypothetical protein